VRARCEALGLEIALYQPLRDVEAVPDDVFAANLRRAEAKFDVMEALGADTVLVCSNVSPLAIDDDGLAAAQLHSLASRAAERGMRIAYEALAWGRHVRDYDHAWRIAEAGDHPSLGTCLDSFHILSRGADPAGIRDIPAEKIFFLQLADAPELVMDVLQWSRHYRCFPGQGGFDLAGFMEHVRAAGYAGPLSLEVFNDVFRQADPERMAVDAMRSLLLLEGGLPEAAALRGYAFAELAVAPEASAGVERLLVAMGFRHAGQHRTKAVQLWRHGDVRVLVNHEPGAGAAAEPPAVAADPRLTAIAVESADPVRSAERAERLLAPPLPRDRGPGEADLTAVAAPDGTSVFFCRTDAPDGWVSDFLTAGEPGAGSELTGIDHIALSQPFDYFDEAALFYRSVLGLELEDGAELVAPDGLVRSRAARSADGRVRFALSVPVVGQGGPGHQHVAFATRDALATAEAMRERGVPLLPIPGNYYDDLAARTQLPAETIDRMRALGVLYDTGPDGAELLHFYTATAGEQLFFEVLERRGGYDGYGAANSPVRLAALRAGVKDPAAD
jgi:3-dehydroshikimate dehydratase